MLVERKGNLVFVDRSTPLTIVNVSPGGMLVRWEGRQLVIDDPFQMCGILIIPKSVVLGRDPGTARIEFERPLTELQFETLVNRLRNDDPQNGILLCETVVASGYEGPNVKAFGHLKLVTRE